MKRNKEDQSDVRTSDKESPDFDNVHTDGDMENPQQESIDVNWEEKYQAEYDKYVRLMAEFDNYRKRTLREKAELIHSGGEKVLSALLPIVDNFERALASIENATDLSAVSQGIELIYQQLMTILKQQGVTPIQTEMLPLDTELHEAIAIVPAPDEALKGVILDCTQKGYLLKDKVIRHAKVVVGE